MTASPEATAHLQQSLDCLRQAGHQEIIVHGLLARAELRRVGRDLDGARADIDEAMEIATRDPGGRMALKEADCLLELGRVSLDQGHRESARPLIRKAREIIHRTGYHRRDKALMDLEAVFG